MLVSQGVTRTAQYSWARWRYTSETDPRVHLAVVRIALSPVPRHPSAMWLDHSFEHLFGIDDILSADTADSYYDHIDDCLGRDGFRPRALFEQFNVEVLATTDAATDELAWHSQLRDSGWDGQVITTYRPDATVDPEFEGFAANLARLAELTGSASTGPAILPRTGATCLFQDFGATATDHGHPSAQRRTCHRPRPRHCSQKSSPGAAIRGSRSLPGPDADGNGADES